MLAIKGSVAIITGGASGLGLELARYWIKRGGKVVLGDVSSQQLYDATSRFGKNAIPVICDVTKEDDCALLAQTAISRFGKINLVAPFAGIIQDGLMVKPDRNTGKVVAKMSLNQFKSVVNVNLVGVFLTVRECVEQMINTNSRGLICLISSTGSLGTAGQINYSATKAAVSVMPKVITAELMRYNLSDRIRCVAVAPGYVNTPILENMNKKALECILAEVPIGRLINPEEIASLVGELYRNEALTGEVFFAHGGLRLASRG